MTDVGALLPPGTHAIPNAPDEPATNGHRLEQRADQLPHDLQAEAALLGAALVGVGAHTILSKVPDGAFYRPAHGTIAHAIRQIADDGGHVDSLTTAAHLEHAGQLEGIGGRAVLAQLLADCPSTTGAEAYARIVLGHHQARQLIFAARDTEAVARAHGPAQALIDLQATLDRLTRTAGAPGADPDLDTFLDQVDDDYDWLVPGLLEHRDRVILTAAEGTGKSTLLRQIAVQLASGIDPFEHTAITPYQVLYIDCENTPRQARRALRQLRDVAGAGYQPGHLRLRILGEAMALADPNVEADIAARIADQHADIVIIGPLYKLISGDPIKEEAAKAVADAIDRLRNIRGSAFLIEAHSPYAENAGKNRPMRPYGASLWSRWPEIGIHLSDTGELKHWRGQRETRAWPTKLEHATPWPWAPAAVDDDAWDGPTQCMDAIVTFLEDAGGTFSLKQLGDRLRERGLSYRSKTIADAARQVAQDDRISCRTGPRGALLYSAIELGDQPFEEF